ncbi:MAG TPA: lysoplasmalogenase [Syntrophales bacterium]|nr:lysoplasmalogenase [Syntrophales bacterium]HOX94635.1 lysoplasmalogenase [Syntrophales bacterium]HPI57128.1 lysoplasmalogenase [Syntrophales bacterium]HPN24785.1 lysoplasmalogenase [Syntrophales bacterium]HQM30072.1 lysoplasmalogenase [Syntrophales bacterium]
MLNIAIFVLALPLLAALLFYARKESVRGLLLTKPVLSALFVMTALVGPHTSSTYFFFVLSGLLFCVAGDVFLIFHASRKHFLAGLISFLAGHVLYSVAFFSMASPGTIALVAATTGLAVGVFVFTWLKPHLGGMLGPVVVYMIAVTVMVVGAASLMENDRMRFAGRALAFCGAVLFYISDIFVARHRFVKKEYANRLAGLPLYYAGQFMIAWSTALL